MNLPNKLTVARVCLIPVFLVALLWDPAGWPAGRYVALGVFALASFTDFLDGYIARARGLTSNFGKLMDPLADKILVAAALIALVELGSVPAWIVVVIISREFLVTGIRLVALSENKKQVISAAFLGKVKTVSQMCMIIFMLCGFSGDMANYISIALMAVALFFTVVSGVEYVVKNASVFKDM